MVRNPAGIAQESEAATQLSFFDPHPLAIYALAIKLDFPHLSNLLYSKRRYREVARAKPSGMLAK